MILMLTHIILMSLRSWCHKLRYERYAKVLYKSMCHAGLYIEKAVSKVQCDGTNAMNLINASSSFNGLTETLVDDGYIRIHRISSLVEIDLTNWISFKDSRQHEGTIRVLVEMTTAGTEDNKKQEDVSLQSFQKVLTFGSVLAWRVENPLGVILACDSSDLIRLIDAFGQDSLALSNGLEISGIATIKTKGSPQHLVSRQENLNALSSGKLAQKEIHKSQTRNAKPPNVLIYCGMEDAEKKFSHVKTSLLSSLNTDAYIVYHLKHSTLISSPWENNAAALIITSCCQLSTEAQEKIYRFVKNDKGKLLSFDSSIDECFSSHLRKCEVKSCKDEGLTQFNFKTWHSVSSVSGSCVYSRLNDDDEMCQVLVPARSPTYTNGHDNGEVNATELNGCSSSLCYDSVSCQDALVVKISPKGGGTVILSQLFLERDPTSFSFDDKSLTVLKKSKTDRLSVLKELLGLLDIDTKPGSVPSLTCCHLVAKTTGLRESFLSSFKARLTTDNILKSRGMCLKFHALPDDKEEVKVNQLPVTTHCPYELDTEFFDLEDYWDNLETRSLGQLVFYTDVIASTMTVFDSLLMSIPEGMGPVAIAGSQTRGIGRAGNAWLSPPGCALFTVPLKFSLDSELGSHLSCLQHIVAVAVVQSVVTLPGYEDLNIRVKWPNDIYFGRDVKLGGVMVTSSVVDNHVFATIGSGFNVSNSKPTMCINDVIRLYNESHPGLTPLAQVTTGQLLGRTISNLERLIHNFQRKGSGDFFKLYYKYWLHGGAKVNVELDKKTEGEIVGVDKFGFLSIRIKEGDLISVRPDGNSFDMMHNLIHLKI